MKIPKALQSLVEDGLIDEVLRPLMSGKEASVLMVESGGEIRCAKVYKDSTHRSFKQRASYEEGRSVRNSRRARAMAKRSKFGKQELEDAWQNTEVDTIYALARAGVRVPEPHAFSEGVLIMELVVDENGDVAPRLNDISLSPARARAYHAFMLNQIVRMLCAGLIHGDLSEYNVLVGAEGPVVIDFPQAVNAAGNNSAKAIFLRDVENMAAYFGRFAPELKRTKYGKEIWKLYERGDLHPDVELTGHVDEPTALADVSGVLSDIQDAREDHERRVGRPVRPEPREPPDLLDDVSDIEIAIEQHERRLRRQVVDIAPSKPNGSKQGPSRPGMEGGNRSGRRRPGRGKRAAGSSTHNQEPPSSNADGGPPKKKRRRRRRRGPSDGAVQGQTQGQTQGQGPRPGGGRPEGRPPQPQTASGEGPPKKKRRRRRRRSSRAPGSTEGGSSS